MGESRVTSMTRREGAMSKASFVRIVAGIAALLLSPGAMGFGGEDVAEGNPWHHEDMTIRALAGPMWFQQADFPAASTCPNGLQQITGGPRFILFRGGTGRRY